MSNCERASVAIASSCTARHSCSAVAHEKTDRGDPGATCRCHLANAIDRDASDRQHGNSRSCHNRREPVEAEQPMTLRLRRARPDRSGNQVVDAVDSCRFRRRREPNVRSGILEASSGEPASGAIESPRRCTPSAPLAKRDVHAIVDDNSSPRATRQLDDRHG